MVLGIEPRCVRCWRRFEGATVWAAKQPESSLGTPVVRVAPVAAPVESNACAAGACW